MAATLPVLLARRIHQNRFDLQFGELDALGIGEGQLRRWVRDGHLVQLGGGSYLINAPHDTSGSNTFEDSRVRYLRRCAAILQGIPGAYLVGPSAATAHHLPLFRLPQDIHLSRRPHARLTRSGLQPHRPWGSTPPMPMGELLVESPAQTVVSIAARYGVESGLMVGDASLHLHLTSREELAIEVQEYGRRQGAKAARLVCRLGDGRIESPGESRLRWVLHCLGYVVIPQVNISTEQGRFVARVDFLLTGTKIVVEFDGLSKYAAAEDLRAEKMRQVELERLGYIVLRIVWSDLDYPSRIDRLIKTALHS